MVNQTDYVNHLREHMNISIEKGFYIESISCSYAIIENRTKRICEHLGKTARRMSLDNKIEFIYQKIKENNLTIDSKLKKLIGYLEYRLKKSDIMTVDATKSYNDCKNDKLSFYKINKIYKFKEFRNNLVHDLATYDSCNPSLIDFDSYIELAMLGKEVAEELSRIASRMKEKNQNYN